MRPGKYLVAGLVLASLPLCAQVVLPRLIRDSMVLQRDAVINVWGRASKGENVTVQFNGHSYHTKTRNDGKWMLKLQAMPAGGPYSMQIRGKNRITLRGILIGDVWFCAGQSNMVHQLRLHRARYSNEIAQCNYPQVRQFTVPNITSLHAPQDDLAGGNWKSANPKDVLDFSVVAYFFARSLYEDYKIPVGIINASWGGTPIDAWISEDGLKAFPGTMAKVMKNKEVSTGSTGSTSPVSDAATPERDPGLTEKWYDPSYKPAGWRRIAIPGYWEDQGIRDLDGVMWYRREIFVPDSMSNKAGQILLGRIADADELYINGKKVGTTGYQYPQRRYQLPEGALKPGRNLFVIRVSNHSGKGGFVPDKPYAVIVGKDTIDLAGYWNYKVGQVFPPGTRSADGDNMPAHLQPSAVYNGMVAPVTNYAAKGFLWYQGEADTARASEYARLQPALIADWRNKWNDSMKYFLFVQLPGYGDYRYLPAESQWAAFREAQAGSLSIHNTAMAVAIDLGEWNDIHPGRKKEIGERLAAAAKNKIYGNRNILPSGPVIESVSIIGNQVILAFTHTGGGLVTTDGREPMEVAIAGADKRFVWSKAKIDSDKLIVWSNEVPEPKYVRYAWADNPVNPNLCNKQGLPAAPFGIDLSLKPQINHSQLQSVSVRQ